MCIDAPLAQEVGQVTSPAGWVAVKELKLSYHNPEARLFTTYLYYGKLNYKFLNSNPEVGQISPAGAPPFQTQQPRSHELRLEGRPLKLTISCSAVGPSDPQRVCMHMCACTCVNIYISMCTYVYIYI